VLVLQSLELIQRLRFLNIFFLIAFDRILLIRVEVIEAVATFIVVAVGTGALFGLLDNVAEHGKLLGGRSDAQPLASIVFVRPP
jgi:hypothetical protein